MGGEVDLDDAADLGHRDVGQRRRLVDHPGIADECLDRAELGGRTLEHRGHGTLVGDVALERDRPATGGADVGRHRLGCVGPAGIVDRHVVAVARAQTTDRRPDATRAAGHQQHLGHTGSPPLLCAGNMAIRPVRVESRATAGR